NLAKGSGGSRDAVRISLPPFGDDDLLPDVAIGEHESAADRDEDAREAEENKRLLYVAMTRARDRLYLATTLGKDRRFAPGPGGTGRVLRAACAELLNRAGQPEAESELVWRRGAATHRFRTLQPAFDTPHVVPTADAAVTRVDRFAPLSTDGIVARISVSDAI